MIKKSSLLRFFAIFSLLFLLLSCGNRGTLYLYDAKRPQTYIPESSGAKTSASEVKRSRK